MRHTIIAIDCAFTWTSGAFEQKFAVSPTHTFTPDGKYLHEIHLLFATSMDLRSVGIEIVIIQKICDIVFKGSTFE